MIDIHFYDSSVSEPNPKAIKPPAKKAVEAGCEDPLVMYRYGRLMYPGDRRKAREAINKALQGLRDGQVSPASCRHGLHGPGADRQG